MKTHHDIWYINKKKLVNISYYVYRYPKDILYARYVFDKLMIFFYFKKENQT